MAPILTENTFDVITHNARQTWAIGRRLGQLLRPGDVVCLEGELGSGKTCLTQGIGAGLRVKGTVRSPTFVLVNEHPSADDGPPLYHVDLYRINEEGEAAALGLEDYLYGRGVTVIEWAERAAGLIPAERLWIRLTYLDDAKRSLHFEPRGEHYRHIVQTLQDELAGRKASSQPSKE
ncbi:MAG: tRNA (adenosine(37)-N6)-threonylcarbamoyltransferase complex ATPase subunit type 1 TsaE [Chloroflexi bacterium]|nr:tRNA (adenosine(37)-N6)-threonylcarbamoyltransferase complex ATPase subunit type 1 TsaE [Chloroflexota bacterium]